jgi:hypothetical protein
MIIPFKFFRGKVYTDEFTLPIARRMSGRTIAQDLSNLSNQVQQIVRSPEFIPAGYVQVPIPRPNYDSYVINIVRRHMNRGLPWRGHQLHVFEPDGYPLLKILGGINIGGMFRIVYLITRDGNTESYNVSVPLVELQNRLI